MKVYCEYCQARCRINEEKIPPAGARVRCPACKKVFFLNPGKVRVKEESRKAEASLLPPPDEIENIEFSETPPPIVEKTTAELVDQTAPEPAGTATFEPAEPAAPEPTTGESKNDSSRLTGLIFSRPLVISIAVAILIEILLVFLWATGRQPVIQSKNSVLSTPVVASSIKSQAIKTIVSHALVGDAAIEQQKNVLTLTLLVDQSTPPAYALKMGRRFVATLKKLTGTGNSAAPAYQFHLFIYYPNGQEVTNQLSTTDDIRDN
jgi:predicted Zn finger-like uncharacterized protein